MPGVGRSKRLRVAVDQFLEAPSRKHPRTVDAAVRLQEAMESEGIQEARTGGALPGLLSGPRGRGLRKKLAHALQKAEMLQQEYIHSCNDLVCLCSIATHTHTQ